MGQMARNLLMSCEDPEIAPRFLVHDRGKLLAWDFDAVLTGAEAKVVKTPFRAPDANAHAERWVRSVTEECLDHRHRSRCQDRVSREHRLSSLDSSRSTTSPLGGLAA